MMEKSILALFFILISLLIIAPKSYTQVLVCEEANGLNWCYNPNACGQACNDVCAVDGLQPVANNIWFEAQNTPDECLAIANEFGLSPDLSDTLVGCLEDSSGTHNAPGGLDGALFCSDNP